MKIVDSTIVFKFNLTTFLLYLALLLLLVSLGFWQLGRADEKRVFLEKQQLSEAKKVIKSVSAINIEPEELRYRKVELSGQYDHEHQFLIDNQILNGQVGYFVMTPFKLGNNPYKAVLVNRGWVALNKDRRILPELSIATLSTTLTGRINTYPVVGIQLAGAEIPTETWPSVVQVIDNGILSKKLGYLLFPFQIELDADMSDGYSREWKKNTIMPPEKHIAYAVQWFGLAITLTILFIWFSRHLK
jgi:surfeit locus 1 family protein